jgi:hypothetical protein
MDNKSIKPAIGTPYLTDSGHGERTAKALGKQEAKIAKKARLSNTSVQMVIFLMILSLSLIRILKYVQIYSEVSFSSSSRYISAYISENFLSC